MTRFPRSARLFAAVGLAASLIGLAPVAKADPIQTYFDVTLGNSTWTINADGDGANGDPGMNSWVVGDESQLSQQWFWIRNSASGRATALHNLTLDGSSITHVDPGVVATVTLAYNNAEGSEAATYSVDVKYDLVGGESATSDVREEIVITNLSDSSQTFSFFQYSDFDLGGDGDGDTVAFLDAETVDQTDSSGLIVLSETVITPPAADRREAAFFGETLDKLNGENPNLADDNSGASVHPPGDVTWAYQWNFTLGAGETFTIRKDKHLAPVPEPTSVAMAALLAPLGVIHVLMRRKKA